MALRALKRILPRGSVPRTLPTGLGRGVRMYIDFSTQTRMYLGLYELELDRHLRRILRPGVTTFDVGAQYGYDALIAANRTRTHVVAFECQPDYITAVERNARLNPSLEDLVEPVEALVGHDADCLGLDEWAFDRGIVPDFIKVDIEGAESSALRSAARILRERHPALVVETHSQEEERMCGLILVNAGYRPVVVSQRRVFRDRRPIPHNRWLVAT